VALAALLALAALYPRTYQALADARSYPMLAEAGERLATMPE
jgi:hypothetical protein